LSVIWPEASAKTSSAKQIKRSVAARQPIHPKSARIRSQRLGEDDRQTATGDRDVVDLFAEGVTTEKVQAVGLRGDQVPEDEADAAPIGDRLPMLASEFVWVGIWAAALVNWWSSTIRTRAPITICGCRHAGGMP
jgi:hypothetical protein